MIDFVSSQQQTAANSLLGLVGSAKASQSGIGAADTGGGFAETLKAKLEPAAPPAPKEESIGTDEMNAMASYAAASAAPVNHTDTGTAEAEAVAGDVPVVMETQDAALLDIADQTAAAASEPPETELFSMADAPEAAAADIEGAPAIPDEAAADITDIKFDTEAAVAQETDIQTDTAAAREPAATQTAETAAQDTEQTDMAAAPRETEAAETAETNAGTGETVTDTKENRAPRHSRADARTMQWRIRHGQDTNAEAPAVPETETPDTAAGGISAEPAETAHETAAPGSTAADENSSGDSERKDETELGRMTEAAAQTLKTEDSAPRPRVQQAETQRFFAEARQVNDQIVRSAQMNRFDGTSRLEIQLQPENLGKISVSLAKNEMGVITAQIRTTNEQVSAMLRATLGELEASLKDMGINMDNIEITDSKAGWDFTNSNPHQNKGSNEQQRQGRYAPRETRGGAELLRMGALNPLTAALRTPYGAAVQNAYITEEISVDYLA